eukprot:TRINITY_DN21151_c0_g1_i1.p2 TRINITY_DN21151_c0_g1~~TRINITY_DN21151_c0_g1_i1.p2  ORF type:complete len:148 (+),score=40.64 TRINITY_DN21151_c0_g1_i1:101-544(+)
MGMTFAVRACFVLVLIVFAGMLLQGVLLDDPQDEVGSGCWRTRGPCRFALGGVARVMGAYFACSLQGGLLNVLVLFIIQIFTDMHSETLTSWAAYSVGAFLYWSSDRLSPKQEPVPPPELAPVESKPKVIESKPIVTVRDKRRKGRA